MQRDAASPPSTLPLALAIGLLTALAALYFAWPVWRAFLPLEIDLNEPWNAYQVDALRAGAPLYPDVSTLTTNNYPPLSFQLVRALAALGADPVYAGRVLSLAATLAIGLAAWATVRALGGSHAAGAVGGVWFVATLARFLDKYVGMYDPNLLGLAVMAWALVWLIRLARTGRAVEPAILLMVAAGFIKHNLLAVPVTALLWLALRDYRLALRAALVGGAASALGLALCGAIYGQVFFDDLLFPREYALATALGSLGRLQWIAPALILFAVWACYRRTGDAARFSVLLVAVSFVFQFLQKLGAGVDDNAQFELIFATAVGLGFAFDDVLAVPLARRLGADRARVAIVAILIARLLLSGRLSPYLLVASPDFHAELNARTAILNSEVARIAKIPGPAICSVQTVCRLAGKPFLLDGFFVQQAIATGKLTQQAVDARLRALGVRQEYVDPRTVADWR
jgi:hypothetical protein